jgi:hypothetical protein
VWDSSPDHTTQAHLTLANADGTEQKTFDIGGEPLSGLSWSGNSKALAFVASDSERHQSLFLVTADGSQKQLIDKAQSINLISGADSDRFNVLWQDTVGDQWLDGFDTNGSTPYHFQVGGGSFFAWYVAPNNQLGAILTIQPNSPKLIDLRFASADGNSTKVIRSGQMEIIGPTWSPDSKLFAFGLAQPNILPSLQIVTADGDSVRNFPMAAYPPGLSATWTRCN